MKRKGYDNSFNSWINKKDILWISEYFAKPKCLGGNVKVELDLPSYPTKEDLKNAADDDKSDFAQKADLANLKSDVNKFNIDEFKQHSKWLEQISRYW